MSTIVENVNPISVEVEPKYSVTATTGAIVEIQEPDYIVHAQRKEYKVVGDNIYIPRLYDDAPQWMKDLIGTVVDIKTAVAVGNLDDALEALRTLSDELEVAKNTYTMSIVSSNDIDERINTAIETLNSALSDADATIMNIAQTAVTPAEASAIALNTLSASLSASGEIGSFIANMNSAFADLDSTTAQSINFMESAIEAEFSANTTALNTIRTYVGIDEAGASTGTGLSAYLEDSNGNIGGADSQLANSIRVTAEGVETKWAYNSTVNIGGVYKKSGFGLTTNYTSGTGTQANPYVSEFWIDASRLKFTNSNQTGQVAPFTIDATGATPNITFNGKVSFSNVTGYTPPDVSGDINANNDVFAQRLGYANYTAMVSAASSGQTIINGGYIRTSLIEAGSIGANQINANAISGKIISGGTITGTNIYGAYIEGAIIKASFIDLTSTQTLTNWQQYTPSNYPSAYANNFAHNNDGTLLVDSLGYVRLMGNTNIVTQQLAYENNYVSGGTTPAITLPTYSIELYAYSDYETNTLNRCITATPTLNIPLAKKIVFCSLMSSAGSTIVRCYINSDYYEITAIGKVSSDSLSYTFSCSVKKNSVVIGSSTAISGVNITTYIGNLPILISVGASWSFGLYPIISITTANTLASSTTINYSGVFGKAFELTYAYSSARMYSSIDVPAITING